MFRAITNRPSISPYPSTITKKMTLNDIIQTAIVGVIVIAAVVIGVRKMLRNPGGCSCGSDTRDGSRDSCSDCRDCALRNKCNDKKLK